MEGTTLIPVEGFDPLDILIKHDEIEAVRCLANVCDWGTYYVAGGYWRDTLNGKQFKDVDVFLPGDEPLPDDKLAIRYGLAGAVEVDLNGVKINIIRLKEKHTLETLLHRMDIGLCQIGMDGNRWQLVCTEAYLKDVRAKTVTVMFDPSLPSDHDHIRRVTAKYPDHSLVPWSPASNAVPDSYTAAYGY